MGRNEIAQLRGAGRGGLTMHRTRSSVIGTPAAEDPRLVAERSAPVGPVMSPMPSEAPRRAIGRQVGAPSEAWSPETAAWQSDVLT